MLKIYVKVLWIKPSLRDTLAYEELDVFSYLAREGQGHGGLFAPTQSDAPNSRLNIAVMKMFRESLRDHLI